MVKTAIVATAVALLGMSDMTASAAEIPAPPKCEPHTQFGSVGFETVQWEYLGSEHGEYVYRYHFNSWSPGTVTCSPTA
ncbi:hypothetical protein GCM10022222_18640 [Amycolatopsis ultiminotia]|uniref:Uncharacterized protein n=1 Tax=Amycolatopsis ultiminotia TaxID=543629 RepID=A0ABP6VG74_9PSEU